MIDGATSYMPIRYTQYPSFSKNKTGDLKQKLSGQKV